VDEGNNEKIVIVHSLMKGEKAKSKTGLLAAVRINLSSRKV